MYKYFFVGGFAAAVDLVIFSVFAIWLSGNYLVVGALGVIITTAVNYALCVKFVFDSGSRFSMHGELTRVYIVSLMGLVFHEIVLYYCYETFGLPLLVCKIVATGSVFFWNFGARNFYVFSTSKTF